MSALSDFTRTYFDHFTRDPNLCLELGVDRHGGELPDRSPDTEQDAAREARLLLSRLDQLEGEPLDFDQHLDLDMARLALSREVFELEYRFNDATQHEQRPRAGDDIGIGLTMLLSNDPRPAAERLADASDRLEAIPDCLARTLAHVRRPVARWSAMEQAGVGGLPALFSSLQLCAEQEHDVDLQRLARARSRAEAALTDYAERLSRLPTTPRLHIGIDQARRLVALRGIDLSLEQLHTMARDYLAETNAGIESLRARLVRRHGLPEDTGPAQLQRHLAEQYRVKLPNGQLEDILVRYQQERERLAGFCRERALFDLDLDEDISIERTPPHLVHAIPAGAMWPPAPFREGTRHSLVHLTLSEDLVDEHTELSIPGMMLHEGTPGHHLQLAWAAQHPSVIRRLYSGNEHHEGWTTYLEDYMLDAGYMGDLEDEARFVGKRDISRIGARVAIDLFFISGERDFLDVGIEADIGAPDPFVAAGNLLTAVTGFVPARVQGELNWYSAERAYPLSYLTGNRMLWKLKRDVERAHPMGAGPALDRAFHDVFLKAGNMPLAFMRRVMEHEGLLG